MNQLQRIPTIKRNHAAYLRAQRAQRDAVIAALGWAPEGRADLGEDYCASTGELLSMLETAVCDRIVAEFERARAAAGFGPMNDFADGINEPYCACGRRWSQCDRSRKRCGKRDR